MSPVRYELRFYIPEDILHSHCRENIGSYTFTFCFKIRSSVVNAELSALRYRFAKRLTYLNLNIPVNKRECFRLNKFRANLYMFMDSHRLFKPLWTLTK
jgi:hypothetical protein